MLEAIVVRSLERKMPIDFFILQLEYKATPMEEDGPYKQQHAFRPFST